MFKMPSSSFPIFVLSKYTTFSQTQTGATVSLRGYLGPKRQKGTIKQKVKCRGSTIQRL
jgi:hypothetical protein